MGGWTLTGTAQATEVGMIVTKTAAFGGALLIVAGLVGFVAPSLMGLHPRDHLVHFSLGAVFLAVGLTGSPSAPESAAH